MVHRTKLVAKDPTVVASGVAWRLRTLLRQQLTTPEKVTEEIMHYCHKHRKSKPKRPLLAELILQTLHILAEKEEADKHTIRALLKMLDSFSPDQAVVRREVYLFEFSSTVVPFGNRHSLYRKMFYMLNAVAGWSLPQPDGSHKMFIDLPLSPYMPYADNNILAEAVYRMQDEKVLLYALRCGATMPGILLWPIGMVLDLHRALQVPLDPDSKESLYIRYFCRTKHWIWVGLMPESHNTRPHGINLPDEVSRDDMLILPDSASCLVPADLYPGPASMKHQCRLAIRRALLRADSLPDGPKQLPLPKILIKYVDLLRD